MEIDSSKILIDSIFEAFKTIVPKFWPYILILLVMVVGKLLYFLYKLYRLSKAGMFEIDKMDGPTFEKYLFTLFQKLGYKVQRVGSFAGDYGADLIIEKEGTRTVVQAKRYKNLIGVDAVREAGSAINLYKCTNSMVVTNNYFTEQAKRLARSNNVVLWDRTKLTNEVLRIRKNRI